MKLDNIKSDNKESYGKGWTKRAGLLRTATPSIPRNSPKPLGTHSINEIKDINDQKSQWDHAKYIKERMNVTMQLYI